MGQVEHERYLLDHPQRLGILPTWWFWNDRKNWRLVRWPFAIAVAALVPEIWPETWAETWAEDQLTPGANRMVSRRTSARHTRGHTRRGVAG
jgi:hypothetical protein